MNHTFIIHNLYSQHILEYTRLWVRGGRAYPSNYVGDFRRWLLGCPNELHPAHILDECEQGATKLN
jgi:hypothetical protein